MFKTSFPSSSDEEKQKGLAYIEQAYKAEEARLEGTEPSTKQMADTEGKHHKFSLKALNTIFDERKRHNRPVLIVILTIFFFLVEVCIFI